MRAIVVSERGSADKLIGKEIDKPGPPQGLDLLISVKACSVNPIDLKVRNGTYDDAPEYYNFVPATDQVIGFDGAGVVEAVGPQVTDFKEGDEVYYFGSPVRPGSNEEYQLVDARVAAKKPRSISFTQAASMPLTYATAYESLAERLEIRPGEQAGILIVNGAGGVGSIATQIARHVLRLPVVITTTSRPETTAFSKEMGATHTVNHREDIIPQVKALNILPSIPLKYVFITHSTTPYLYPAAALCAPFGKVCSIVQTKEMNKMYGTEFTAKSLAFIWCWLGTKPYYGGDIATQGRILSDLSRYIDERTVRCHMQKELPLTVEGLREAHRLVEGGKSLGKVACGVDLADPGSQFA